MSVQQLNGAVVDADAAWLMDAVPHAQGTTRRALDEWLAIGERLQSVRERMPDHRAYGAWLARYNHFGVRRHADLSDARKAWLYVTFTNSKGDELGTTSVQLLAAQQRELEQAQAAADAPPTLDDIADNTPPQTHPTPPPQPTPAAPAEQPTPHVAHNSGENEWYTPGDILDAARRVFDAESEEFCPEDLDEHAWNGCDCPAITTDPATSPKANETVRAKYAYTVADDGLTRQWRGNVWMNPPYSQPLIGLFIDKLLAEIRDGRIRQAIVLVNNASETRWGRALLENADAVCFPTGRIRFVGPRGNPGAPLQGQMICYFNPGWVRPEWDEYQIKHPFHAGDPFADEFDKYGPVLRG